MSGLRVRFVAKADSRLMRAAGWLLRPFVSDFMSRFWTTLRLPGWREVIIYYPSYVTAPDATHIAIRHELAHARQLRPWWGPWWFGFLYFLAPLPVLFSGRWLVERSAYLQDIRAGRYTPATAADVLWRSYLWPWPPSWMRSWFERQIEGDK